nr:translational initiation factor 1 [Parietaria mauritanica]YP_010470173.1 translational initiation factor 1 [Parietaria judaica]UVF31653.1 translational initiation factor 1 [Parietaria mauritanica]UVF34826.1 translational initiation factor 1 [Parietaria judaica]
MFTKKRIQLNRVKIE